MEEIAFCSASQLARMIRTGEISSCELLDIYAARIEKFNPVINAVVTLDIEGARRRAQQADRLRSQGTFLGPLHGVPLTIKDGFETAGMRSTSGAPQFKDHIPGTHADAVQRYVDAGAIIMGKTNVPLFCADAQSYNELYGTTNNPWDVKRTPGGSSGGAAAALAAGLTGLELGSDIAGSIRLPAAWSGVYGHRPTHGIVPFRGHIPPPPGILSEADLSVAGPLARSAADLKLALSILAGPDQWCSSAWKLELPKPRTANLKEFRIAAWLEDESIPTDSETAACLRSAVEALRSAGATVDEKARPGVDAAEAYRTYSQLLVPIIAAGLPSKTFEMLKQMAQAAGEETELIRFSKDATLLHRHWLSANAKRYAHRRLWMEFFKKYDVLLCPVTCVPAIAHNTTGTTIERTITVDGRPAAYSNLLKWAGIFTHVHLPVTSAPIGRTSSGLPVGIQIVGPYLEDFTTIAFAEHLAKVIGGFEPPPGY
ncbi:MAG: amidase [Desulfobacteraceae bacterium]|nr:MAG: amidase [Desulfobacteraceae bacterium]